MIIKVITGLGAFLVLFGFDALEIIEKPCMPHICNCLYICICSYRLKGGNWWGGKWSLVQRDAPPFPEIYIAMPFFLFPTTTT